MLAEGWLEKCCGCVLVGIAEPSSSHIMSIRKKKINLPTPSQKEENRKQPNHTNKLVGVQIASRPEESDSSAGYIYMYNH